MLVRAISLFSMLVAPVALLACGADDNRSEDPTSEAVVAITQVPTGVACISITAAGSRTVQKQFNVMAGQSSAMLSMNGLPTGAVNFSGSAYSTACNGVTASSTPAVVADPPPAQLSVGTVAQVNLQMRRNGQAQVNVDFEGDTTCLAAGSACNATT